MRSENALWSLTLDEVVADNARSRPAEVATVCREGRWTWGELEHRVERVASLFARLGVGVGDRVLWLGQNCHRLLEALVACGHLGAVFCPVNWRQSSQELAFVIEDASPRLILWQEEEIGATVEQARQAATTAATWLCHDATGPNGLEGQLADAELPPEPAGTDASPVLMIYTGAFGGRPNGALLSHRAMVSQSAVIALVRGYRADAVFLNSGPLFHLGTLMSTFAVFLMGGRNVFVRRVEAEQICRIIEAERCTDAFLMPPTVAEIVELNSAGTYDLSSLRVASGTPEWRAMVSEDPSEWAVRPGGTGQTEVSGLVTFAAFGGTGIHGRSSPLAQVRIHDEADRELAPGEVGEIVVRGPVVMNGYLHRDKETKERQRNGWHHTGDLGRREADGSITFVGPKSRMIKSAAENIYPAEVEACIREHPAVSEVAVIGVPDERWAQSVKAVVVLEEGHPLSTEELVEHCRSRIASYKKPRHVEFVDHLPKRGLAIDYEALDAAHGGGGYPGGSYRSV